ncbi:unnamed protein product [Euphydryas editha]|uniref:Reverse transcriptase domain-containing protein n=1 Tax=Euphydryas editha TaxID=104508 RepID=A0AAU9UMA1_EUPED|nr:unnamed protein product [Euphydryas editha]
MALRNKEKTECKKKNGKGTESEREIRNSTDKRRHIRTDRDSRHRPEQRNTENRYPEKNKKQEGQRAEKKFDCSRCGYYHSERRCPAYGKKCKKCEKMNHFARKCRARDAIKAVQESDSSGNESCDMYLINISNINVERNWYEYVYFTELNRNLKFKLDTGAQCNVISANDCYRFGISKFDKTNCKLTSYSNEKIETLGKIKLSVKINEQIQKIEFQVCKGNYIPILGLPTLIKFKLIQRTNNEKIDSVQTKNLELLEKYKDVFKGIGEIKNYEYDIQLKEGWQRKIERNRHIPFKLKDKLKEELSKLEKIGIISKTEGPTDFVSSLVMTTKPGGAMRICLDPQYLNTQIKREQMMIPNIDEIIAKLKGSNYFSTLDANKGFWMIKLTNNSKNLTTFNTPFGRYYFNRLPFGLASSPEVFHRVFSEIFKDIDGVELYIDDILIHTKTEEEHDRILEQVLKKAQEYNIKFNRKKCNFKKKEVKYLGHVLTTEGIKVDQNRIKAIVEMKEPKTQKELLRFLGMINYVARFIPNVSEVTASLRQLIKKDVPFLWSKEQDKAYKTLKKLLIEPPVLSYFDMNKQIVLSVDASKAGLGKELVVADHLSRSHLLETEENSDLKVETHVAMIMESYRISDEKLEELVLETAKDEELMADTKDKHRQELLNKQEIQKKYYNRGCRNLPELREGEIVKIQDENCKKPHESGIVIGKGSGPRSYQVRNESGNILTRNRKMLIKGGRYYDRSKEEDQGNSEDSERHMIQERDIQTNVIPRENYNGSSGQVISNNDASGSRASRSGRLIKRPSYLKDFV